MEAAAACYVGAVCAKVVANVNQAIMYFSTVLFTLIDMLLVPEVFQNHKM